MQIPGGKKKKSCSHTQCLETEDAPSSIWIFSGTLSPLLHALGFKYSCYKVPACPSRWLGRWSKYPCLQENGLTIPSFLFFFNLIFILCWGIIDLQFCVSFCHTAKCYTYMCVCTHSFSDSFLIWVITEYWVAFPVYTVGPCWLSILYMVVCIKVYTSIPISYFIQESPSQIASPPETHRWTNI